jgi:hypothetical protein
MTIFNLKPIIEIDGNPNNAKVDLTYPSVRYNYDPYIIGIYAVNEQSEMRPDIASQSSYGVVDFWDILLKYNGISNPFSLCKEDRLMVPSLDDMRDNLASSGKKNAIATTVRGQFIDVSKKAKQDPKLAAIEKKRREAQRKKAENVGVSSVSNLPPNIAEEGDREIIIKGGKVQFGPNISRGKTECEVPLSKSEFIAKLIKNRINGK